MNDEINPDGPTHAAAVLEHLARSLVDDPDGVSVPGEITNVTEPKSGLSLQVREFYDLKLGSHQRTYSLIYGCARGQTSSLSRIV